MILTMARQPGESIMVAPSLEVVLVEVCSNRARIECRVIAVPEFTPRDGSVGYELGVGETFAWDNEIRVNLSHVYLSDTLPWGKVRIGVERRDERSIFLREAFDRIFMECLEDRHRHAEFFKRWNIKV